MFEASAKEFCEINNFFSNSDKRVPCKKGNILFGYQEFDSDNSKFEYEFNKEFKISIIKVYSNEIINFLQRFCVNNHFLKIKEITNLNKESNFKFNTKIIVTCNLK